MSSKDEADYLVAPAAVYIWKAILRDNPSGALAIMRVILSGTGAIVVHGLPSTIQFTREDVYDEIKLRQFLEQKPYYHDVDALLTKYPPTDRGLDLYQMVLNVTSELNEEDKKKYLSLFFTTNQPEEKRPVEISEAKPPVPASAIAGSLTDDYMEFLERGKRLGISLVTMSIILPEKTRQQLLTEQLDQLRSEKTEGQ